VYNFPPNVTKMTACSSSKNWQNHQQENALGHSRTSPPYTQPNVSPRKSLNIATAASLQAGGST